MTVLRTTLAAIVTVVALGASQASAGGYAHIDSLALQLQRQSSDLYYEFKAHYSHAAHAGELRNDAARLYHLARHIHEVAHVRGSLRHIESDLAIIDSQFHHLEDLVDHIEDDAFFGHGHVHGDTRHVKRMMLDIEDTIHHLRADVRELRLAMQPVIIHKPHVVHGHGHNHGHNHNHGGGQVQWNGGGIKFGNGGIKIKF